MFSPARVLSVVLLLAAACGDDASDVKRDPNPATAGEPVNDGGTAGRDGSQVVVPIDGTRDGSVADAGTSRVDAAVSPGCGGIAGLPCASDEYCDFESASTGFGCGYADMLGSCEPAPKECNDIAETVCGCDGKTYGNACEAHAAGTSVSAMGPCKEDRALNCDERDVLCKRARPRCAEGQVPSVVEGCWGDCAPIAECVCHQADECPLREQYVCHMHVQHCGPYVN